MVAAMRSWWFASSGGRWSAWVVHKEQSTADEAEHEEFLIGEAEHLPIDDREPEALSIRQRGRRNM
jgi:hypothetical protein